jgi:hypothetical protein
MNAKDQDPFGNITNTAKTREFLNTEKVVKVVKLDAQR